MVSENFPFIHTGGSTLRKEQDIGDGLLCLGLADKLVAMHSSLSSLGHVVGGARTVVDALESVCDTVLAPTYSSIGRTLPPLDDRPARNGCDYEHYEEVAGSRNVVPFDPATFDRHSDVDLDMGAIPRELLSRPQSIRSGHPSVSWVAHDRHAEELLPTHRWDDPNAPLKRTYEGGGIVLLLGVELTQCTALHLAEEFAGRRPFIRWVRCVDGSIRRIREYGCSEGFEVAFSPRLSSLSGTTRIGDAVARTYPLDELVDAAANLIRRRDFSTMCSHRCERCVDADAGGPGE